MNNAIQMMQEFINFKNSFKGDPKAEVEKLVASGQISQAQFDELQNSAKMFAQMLGMK